MDDAMSGKINSDVLQSLLKYGIAFVDGVPPTSESTEAVILQLFRFIKDSFLGKMWKLTNEALVHPGSGYTSGE